MTAHDHSEFVSGCFRCELSRDEVAVADIDLPDLHSRNPLDVQASEIPTSPDG